MLKATKPHTARQAELDKALRYVGKGHMEALSPKKAQETETRT